MHWYVIEILYCFYKKVFVVPKYPSPLRPYPFCVCFTVFYILNRQTEWNGHTCASFIVFLKWWDATTIKLILRRNRISGSYKVRNDVCRDKVFCGESLSSWFWRRGLGSRSSTALIQVFCPPGRKTAFSRAPEPRFHLEEQKTWLDSGCSGPDLLVPLSEHWEVF